jgi:hypothetical protein
MFFFNGFRTICTWICSVCYVYVRTNHYRTTRSTSQIHGSNTRRYEQPCAYWLVYWQTENGLRQYWWIFMALLYINNCIYKFIQFICINISNIVTYIYTAIYCYLLDTPILTPPYWTPFPTPLYNNYLHLN